MLRDMIPDPSTTNPTDLQGMLFLAAPPVGQNYLENIYDIYYIF